ncbi:MAG: hypothetical protein AAGA66_09670 [Bacteroidota bacterium]
MIKNTLLNQKCKRVAKRRTQEHSSYVSATHIGILYNKDEFETNLVRSVLEENLKDDGKNISMLAFQQKETDVPYSFSKKNITISGDLDKDSANYFIKQSFDFLITLDTSGDIHFKYVLAMSKAVCKIGIYSKAYSDLLLMTLKPSKNPTESIEDLIKYLKMI